MGWFFHRSTSAKPVVQPPPVIVRKHWGFTDFATSGTHTHTHAHTHTHKHVNRLAPACLQFLEVLHRRARANRKGVWVGKAADDEDGIGAPVLLPHPSQLARKSASSKIFARSGKRLGQEIPIPKSKSKKVACYCVCERERAQERELYIYIETEREREREREKKTNEIYI